MNKKLLVICGPTATGKTKLALHLAKLVGGEIISADSRQVYKYMDIGTGKDIPRGFKIYNSRFNNISYYSNGSLKIWGYDLVRPDQEFSVKNYFNIVSLIIKDIYKRHKLPILVGGTGLYIKSVLEPMPNIHIPKDNALRRQLSKNKVSELFSILFRINPEQAMKLNSSDRKNPRRLIRHIEISKYLRSKNKSVVSSSIDQRSIKFDDILVIGLRTKNRDELYKRIEKRVRARVGKEMTRELNFLKKKDFFKYIPSLTLGYRQWNDYLEGKLSKKEAINIWIKDEQNYAKRQIAWFKKDSKIHWIDITDNNYRKRVDEMVKKWYKDGIKINI